MPDNDPAAVVATISGKDLLDRLDALSTSFTELSRKLDDIPTHVADHEARIRVVEARRPVTWPQMAGVITVLLAIIGTWAAVMQAMHG